MSRPSEPFNAEERDLAQRLARLGGPREPAAALDAMILAAARAAVSETATPAAPAAGTPVEPPADPKVAPRRPRKPAPRWPVGFGLAASVVLAASIGWRLQIDGDSHSEAASAPTAVLHDEASHDEATEAVILEPPLQRTPPPPPPPLEEADALARRADAPRSAAAKAAAAPREPEFAADAPALQSAMAEAPPAPAPPAPVAAAVGGSPAADASLDEIMVTGSRVQRERTTGAAEYTRTPLNDRREQAAQASKSAPSPAGRAAGLPAAPPPSTSGERVHGFVGNVEGEAEERKVRDKARDSDGYDDRPPVSADSPEFRQAWLQRIRAQIAKGDTEAAREGLQEFRRRYPDVELPDDLRKLAATLPPPTP